MTTRLSSQDWDELWNESVHKGSITKHSDGGDRIQQGCVEDLCQVYDRRVQLHNGLRLRIYNYEPLDTLIKSSQYSTHLHFVLSFFIKGNVNTTLNPIVNDVAECPGKNYLCCHSGARETEEWQVGQKIFRVHVSVKPQALLATFGTELIEQLAPDLQSLIIGNKQQPYYYLGTTTPQMQQAIQQILNCPYQGLLKQMHLESRALDLIKLRFAQFMEDGQQTLDKTRLQKDNVDRIHWAKDILIANFNNPPSLTELARQVGLNDCILKRGFREVFGTTAFGYLRDYRLGQAQLLLLENQLSITAIAHQVGYTNRCAFGRAFRKKFGVTPKSLYKNRS